MNALSNQGSSGLATRIERVRSRIRTAAARAGRPPEAVTLLPVVKMVSDAEVAALLDLGIREIAESRVQRLLARPADLLARARVHLIGPLQTNKARDAARLFDWIHSVDRMDLARELSRRAGDRVLNVLLEVNLAGEPRKGGVAPAEVKRLAESTMALSGLRVRGLMAIPPAAEDPEHTRPYFRQLRELRDQLGLEHCSMGMSADYEVAIEEGATMVRVGTAIFGPRAPLAPPGSPRPSLSPSGRGRGEE